MRAKSLKPPGPYQLKRSQDVPLPLEEVFPFFSKAENLEEITPPFLNFSIKGDPPSGHRVRYCH